MFRLYQWSIDLAMRGVLGGISEQSRGARVGTSTKRVAEQQRRIHKSKLHGDNLGAWAVLCEAKRLAGQKVNPRCFSAILRDDFEVAGGRHVETGLVDARSRHELRAEIGSDNEDHARARREHHDRTLDDPWAGYRLVFAGDQLQWWTWLS